MFIAARYAVAAFALMSLVACGSSPAPQAPADAAADEQEAQALGRDTDATVFDDLIQTQDKARAVEGVTLGHKDDLDRALETAEGDAPVDDE